MSSPWQSPSGKAPGASVLVVGGGRFGRLAVQRLGGRVRAVVEPHPCPELLRLDLPVWQEEGATALQEALQSPHPPRWIVPCLPRHLLADWLTLNLAPLHPVPLSLPSGLPPLPQVLKGPEHIHYLSLTHSLCPDDCPEPGRVCPKTGENRGLPLFSRLRRLSIGDMRLGILRSHQLAPGVGGLAAKEMLELRQSVAQTGGAWLMGTACRCHGVVQAWSFSLPAASGKDAP